MVSTGAIQECLRGMGYPAGKNDLIKKAKSNNASQEVLDVLNKLPDKKFSTPIDVNKAVGSMD